MTEATTLEITDLPPSLNRIATRGSRWGVRDAKKMWERLIFFALLEANVPKGLTHVTAKVRLRFKDRRRRDPGNFTWMLEKALGDVLAPHDSDAAHRWLPDDTADYFSFISPARIEPPGKPRTAIDLTLTPATCERS